MAHKRSYGIIATDSGSGANGATDRHTRNAYRASTASKPSAAIIGTHPRGTRPTPTAPYALTAKHHPPQRKR